MFGISGENVKVRICCFAGNRMREMVMRFLVLIDFPVKTVL